MSEVKPTVSEVTPTKSGGKGRGANPLSKGSPTATNDDIIPVLLAANYGLVLNYKEMEALDPQHRTASSWEHKFRKWRARAKDIAIGITNADENSKDTGDIGGNTKAEPAANEERKTSSSLEVHGSNGGVDVLIHKSDVVKKVTLTNVVEIDMVAKKNGTPDAMIEGDNAGDNQAVPKKSNSAKKRPAKTPAPSDDSSLMTGEDEGPPFKKARSEKKGVARVVKKPTKRPSAVKVEITDNEIGDGPVI